MSRDTYDTAKRARLHEGPLKWYRQGMAEKPEGEAFRLGSLVLPFYVPSAIGFLGIGIAVPLLALYAKELGAGVSGAAFIVGMVGAGSLAFNIPAGQLIGRYGLRRVILTATAAESVLAALAAFAPSPAPLGAAAFGLGMTQTTFFVTRLSYIRTLVPAESRGRALSVIGGENRFGYLVGPIAGGALAQLLGYRAAFLVYAGAMMLACAALAAWVPQISTGGRPERWSPYRTWSILRDNARIFSTAGVAIVALQLMRTARQALIPLVAASAGLSVARIGLVLGSMFFVEVLLVVPAGILMDRLGRKATAIPCMVLLASGLAILPFVDGLPLLYVAVVVSGLGNGLGSGINMTLSADFSPRENPGEFIGVWRLVVDTGTMAGPFIVGLFSERLGLGGSAAVVAALGAAGAAVMGFLAPEPGARGSAGDRPAG